MGALISFITTLSPTSKTPEPTALPSSRAQEVSGVRIKPGQIPYWQVNVPEDRMVQECPEFLKVRERKKAEEKDQNDGVPTMKERYEGISERDRDMINLPSDEYHIQSWETVRQLIGLQCKH